MENFDDYEKKSYQSGEKYSYSASDYFTYFFQMWLFGTKVMFLAIKELITNLFRRHRSKDVRGQLALITGGANGLGRAIAVKLAMEGCDIVIIDINENEAMKTAQEIRDAFSVKVKAYKVDVSDFEAIQRLKDDIEADFPGQSVDILVNNAGILSKISLGEGQYQQVQKVIDVNLTAHFWTTRTFLSQMIEKKRGHIVGISSMSAKVTLPCAISYCATKFGVDGFYRALYDELCVDEHDDYIFTTCIFPSFINTREELTKILDQMKGVGPRMSASYVASKVVDAIKNNQRSLILPYHARLLYFAAMLPPKAMKYAKTQWAPRGRIQMIRKGMLNSATTNEKPH